MKVKRFFQKTKLRKIVIPVLLLFMAIVGCLTASSAVINRNISESAMANTPVSTKAIITSTDGNFEDSLAAQDDVEYTKIGNNIYVVDYADSGKAQQAIYQTYQNDATVITNTDTVFETAGHFNSTLHVQKSIDTLPDGMTWREYADSVGKKIVAVIDTGVSDDYSSVQMNFTDESDADENGHGTDVAKTILSNANEKAIIMSLKAMGKDGSGYMSNIMAAVQYAREQHVDVINMSIAAADNGATAIFKQLITDSIADGIKVVAAAGNYNASTLAYIPANIDGVISVGAIDENNKKIESSNYAATYYEKADSTSQATAVFTGKLVSGVDIKDEATDSDITYDFDNVESSLLKETTRTIDSKDGALTIRQNYSFNISSDIYNEIAASKSDYYISSNVQIPQLSDFGAELFDSKYGSYHYIFDNNQLYNSAEDKLEHMNVDGFVFKSEKEPQFKIQADFRGGSKFSILLSVSQSGDTTSWTIYAETDQYRSCQNRAMNWSVNIGGSTDSGTATGLYIGKNSKGQIASGSFTGKTGDISVSASISKNGTWTNSWSTSSCSGTFSTGRSSNVTYKVTYNGNNGTPTKNSDSATVTPGSNYTVTLPGASRAYYNHTGWGWAADNNPNVGQPWSSVTFGAGNHTIYAAWQGKSLRVTYDGNGEGAENLPGEEKYTYGTNGVTSNKTPTRKGYTFEKWNTKRDGTGVNYHPQQPTFFKMAWEREIGDKDGNLTVYAQWNVHHYNIVYNANDTGTSTVSTGTTASDTGIPFGGNGSEVTIKKNGFTKTGYTFAGWNTKADGTGTKYTEGQKVKGLTAEDNGTVTLYAQWKPAEYSVQFDANGGRHVRTNANDRKDYSIDRSTEVDQLVSGKMAVQSQTFDKATKLTANGFKWEGHTFLGWSKDPNATVAVWKDTDFASNSKNANGGLTATDGETVTLYAIWKADAHPVTIDPVKGSGTWNPAGDLNQSGSSAVRKGEDSVNHDKAGNTKWGDKVILGEAIPDNKDATITYDVNTDEAVNIDKTSETVHWKFSKWTKNAGANGILYNNSSRANDGSHDNGAQTYYIVQDTNDTVTANYYMQSVVLPTPSRNGYTFLGWYYDAGCTDKVDGRGPGGTKYPLDANGEEMKAEYQTRGNGGDTFRTDRDITIYARWQKNSYNYADTLQAFMQDDNGTGEQKVMIRKIDKTTKQPLTSVTINGKTSYFKLEVYKNSISSSNKVITIQTDTGVFDAGGNKLAGKTADADGWYDVSAYLTPGETYIVHESVAAPGYSIAKDQTFVYTPNSTTQISVADEIVRPGDAYFLKIDSQGRPMSNVVFTLKDETTGEIIKDFKTNSKGLFSKEKDPVTGQKTITMYNYCTAGHRYSLTEKSAPAGFKLAAPVYFTMPDDGSSPATITVEDTPKTAGKLQIQKLNHDDEPLAGAVFQLFTKDADGNLQTCYMKKSTNEWVAEKGDSDDVVEMIGTTGDDGIVTFKNLPVNASYTGSEPDFTKKYYLKEVQAPEGYSLLTDIMEIKLPEDSDGQTFTYTVKDDSVTLTLEAGGFGNPMIYVGCGAIALLSVLAVIKRRRINA